MPRTRGLAALALAAVALLAGCGGDETQSEAAWVESADGICAAADRISTRLPRSSSAARRRTSTTRREFVSDELVPSLQSQHDEIADLAAPEGAEDEADALLAALQDGIDKLEADPAAIAQQGADAPLAEANQLADKLGLTDCGG